MRQSPNDFWKLSPRAIFACFERHNENVLILEKSQSQRTAVLCATIMNARASFGKGRPKTYKASDFLPEKKGIVMPMTAKQALTGMMAWGASVKATGK